MAGSAPTAAPEIMSRLGAALGLREGAKPFPWQDNLLRRLLDGAIPRALDLPTGLGKTSVMAIWLIARAAGAPVPRRLVYVVDRRAVVDQSTAEAERLRAFIEADRGLKQALGLERPLPISTLRGQFVDNREWLEDPSAPAIVLGTVDMIGSRLLFSGYGVSRKMRPYHAGLLGADSLIVLDEAHLVPPFERLVERIADGVDARGRSLRPAPALDRLVPRLRLMSLSATSRDEQQDVVQLSDADRKHPVVKKRLAAAKRLVVRSAVADKELPDALAAEAWKLSKQGRAASRVIVFCTSRDHAQKVRAALEAFADRSTAIDTELFVGGRRVYERDEAARWLGKHGFLAGSEHTPPRASFVVATAAGEVGVDLDADHAVCDLVAWERMVQRFGRVNRRGDGDADVVVVPAANDAKADAAVAKLERWRGWLATAGVEEDDEDADDDADEASNEAAAGKAPKIKPEERRLAEAVLRREATRELLGQLRLGGEARDASPGGILHLRDRATRDPALRALLQRATTPPPLHPPLTRPLLEAWSMTSLEDHTGRPEVAPWIRGWPDEPDEPQTTVVWRWELPISNAGEPFGAREHEAFRDAADPHLAEQLETETRRVVDWLVQRCEALGLSKATPRRSRDQVTEPAADEASATSPPEPALPEPPSSPAQAMDGTQRPLHRTPSNQIVVAMILDARDGRDRPLLASQLEDIRSLMRSLAGATLLVDARLGGLDKGLLAADHDEPALDVTQVDPSESDGSPLAGPRVVPFRLRRTTSSEDRAPRGWRNEATLALSDADVDDGEALVIESLVDQLAGSENGRSAARHAQALDAHQAWTAAEARRLATHLGLGPYADLLELAAALHDEGKRAERWQRAFAAPPGEPLAKSTSRPNLAVLDGYRHELGSLPYAEAAAGVAALSAEQRELCLHLIAAHHGAARPTIRTDSAPEPPTRLEERARQITLRFAALEQAWGPWGLAWWETLLRAADQRASRRNDQEGGDRG